MLSFRTTLLALVLIAPAFGSDALAPQGPNACSPGSVCAATSNNTLNDVSSLLQVHSSTIHRATEYADNKDYSPVADMSVLRTRPLQLDFEDLVDSSTLGPPTTKEFVYIRHGESNGNKAGKFHWASIPTLGIWNANFAARAADGVLTSRGEEQPVQRVLQMDTTMLRRISKSQLVMTSPLRRAMGTSIIVIAEVLRRCSDVISADDGSPPGMCEEVWPTDVQVSRFLREKVKTGSEWPGCGGDPLKYIDEIVAKYVIGLPLPYAKGLVGIGDRMKQSYIEEKERATTKKAFYRIGRCLRWDPMPEDGASYQNMITHFKDFVVRYPQTKTLIVAHSGWARYAFSPWLPDGDKSKKPADEKVKEDEKQLKMDLGALVKDRKAAITTGKNDRDTQKYLKSIPPRLAKEYKANSKATGQVVQDPEEDHEKHADVIDRDDVLGDHDDIDIRAMPANDQYDPLGPPMTHEIHNLKDSNPLLSRQEERGELMPEKDQKIRKLTDSSEFSPGKYARVLENQKRVGVVQDLEDGDVLGVSVDGDQKLFRPDELEPIHDLAMPPPGDGEDDEDDEDVDRESQALLKEMPENDGDLLKGGRKIRPLGNAGLVIGDIAHVPMLNRAVFQNVVIDTVGPCGSAYPNTEPKSKWGMFNNLFEPSRVVPRRIPDGSCQDYGAFEKQMAGFTNADVASTRNKWQTRIIFLTWASGRCVLSWGNEWGKPKGLMRLVSATLAGEGNSVLLEGTQGKLLDGTLVKKVFTIRKAQVAWPKGPSPDLTEFVARANLYLDPVTPPCPPMDSA